VAVGYVRFAAFAKNSGHSGSDPISDFSTGLFSK
jgi:hypothetical protein